MCITQGGSTPLMTAAFWGTCDVALDLLDSGADFNTQNNVSHCHLRLEPFPYMYMYMYVWSVHVYTCTLSEASKVHGSQ